MTPERLLLIVVGALEAEGQRVPNLYNHMNQAVSATSRLMQILGTAPVDLPKAIPQSNVDETMLLPKYEPGVAPPPAAPRYEWGKR